MSSQEASLPTVFLDYNIDMPQSSISEYVVMSLQKTSSPTVFSDDNSAVHQNSVDELNIYPRRADFLFKENNLLDNKMPKGKFLPQNHYNRLAIKNTDNENDLVEGLNDQNDVIAYLLRKQEKESQSRKRILVKELLQELEYSVQFSSETSGIERKILEIVEKYSFDVLGEVLQEIYISNFDNPNIIIEICQALCRFDLKEVSPWGQVILVSLLSHKDDSVQEYFISLIDNWADVSLLHILKSIKPSKKWMKKYIEDIIKQLEK